MSLYYFTSESVSCGHPDKVADQISDAILDACLREDPHSRVACETMVSQGMVVIAGEITSSAKVDYAQVVRQTIKEIGYNDPTTGFDYRSCGIVNMINKQSSDISLGVSTGKGLFKEQGAGDQGIMFGFACDETPQFMPMPIMLSHQLIQEVQNARRNGTLEYLRPDAKAQVTIKYNSDGSASSIDTVVLSTQHQESVSHATIESDIKNLIHKTFPNSLLSDETKYYINPTGRFVIGGPAADCGLTGRKVIVDTYGGMGHHGGGAFSGKDPSKVDRSASYAARYVAKNIVAARLARKCEVQISYAIGVPHPISIKVDTFGTARVPEESLAKAIPVVFDLTAKGMIEMLNLLRPIYLNTASGGHFGRTDVELPWEKTDKVQKLLDAVTETTKGVKLETQS